MVVENTLNKAIAQKMYRVQDIQVELHDLFQLARQARNRAHSTRRAARTMIEKCQQTRHTRAVIRQCCPLLANGWDYHKRGKQR
jgi:hypothetical protein